MFVGCRVQLRGICSFVSNTGARGRFLSQASFLCTSTSCVSGVSGVGRGFRWRKLVAGRCQISGSASSNFRPAKAIYALVGMSLVAYPSDKSEDAQLVEKKEVPDENVLSCVGDNLPTDGEARTSNPISWFRMLLRILRLAVTFGPVVVSYPLVYLLPSVCRKIWWDLYSFTVEVRLLFPLTLKPTFCIGHSSTTHLRKFRALSVTIASIIYFVSARTCSTAVRVSSSFSNGRGEFFVDT